MDPIRDLMLRWARERAVFQRSGSSELIALSETHSVELQQVLATISEMKVPYAVAEDLTGWSLGSLKNRLQNVGTRTDPAFRLGDLPFKAGKASPAKLVTAARVLRALEG